MAFAQQNAGLLALPAETRSQIYNELFSLIAGLENNGRGTMTIQLQMNSHKAGFAPREWGIQQYNVWKAAFQFLHICRQIRLEALPVLGPYLEIIPCTPCMQKPREAAGCHGLDFKRQRSGKSRKSTKSFRLPPVITQYATRILDFQCDYFQLAQYTMLIPHVTRLEIFPPPLYPIVQPHFRYTTAQDLQDLSDGKHDTKLVAEYWASFWPEHEQRGGCGGKCVICECRRNPDANDTKRPQILMNTYVTLQSPNLYGQESHAFRLTFDVSTLQGVARYWFVCRYWPAVWSAGGIPETVRPCWEGKATRWVEASDAAFVLQYNEIDWVCDVPGDMVSSMQRCFEMTSRKIDKTRITPEQRHYLREKAKENWRGGLSCAVAHQA